MERAIKKLREINTLILRFYFLHMYRYKIPCVKFLVFKKNIFIIIVP